MTAQSTYRFDSPDLPYKEIWTEVVKGQPPVLQNYPVEECVQDVKLTEQRNWIPKNPILLGRWSSNCYDSSQELVASIASELTPCLNERMAVAPYGAGVNLLVTTYSLSFADRFVKSNYIVLEEDVKLSTAALHKRLLTMFSQREIEENRYYLRPRFEYGNFVAKTGCMKIHMHFPREFSEQSTRDQKNEFGQRLMQAVSGAIERLKKKRLDFDLARMEDDLRRVVGDWVERKVLKSK